MEEIVTELIQNNFNSKKFSSEIIKILETENVAKNQITNFNKLKKLGQCASKTMASIITSILSDSSLK